MRLASLKLYKQVENFTVTGIHFVKLCMLRGTPCIHTHATHEVAHARARIGLSDSASYSSVYFSYVQVHNIAAFTLHIIPLMYLWERAIGVHEKPNWIRLPLRTFPLLIVWFFAIAFPFCASPKPKPVH